MPCEMISRLSIYWKMLKIDAKRDPQRHGFRYKIDQWASKGLFIECFGLIWGDSKKLRFFDVAPEIKKSMKSILRAPRAEKGPKIRAPVVDCGNGRDPGEGVGGGESLPLGEEGLKAECS